jgi:hypothetical protein
MEWRKHYTQMNPLEEKRIYKIIKNNAYRLTEHAKTKMIERNILNRDINESLRKFDIIELHWKQNCPRVLIRNQKDINGYSICLVIDLLHNEIVTVYKNKCSDNHYTLDDSIYFTSINLLDSLKCCK